MIDASSINESTQEELLADKFENNDSQFDNQQLQTPKIDQVVVRGWRKNRDSNSDIRSNSNSKVSINTDLKDNDHNAILKKIKK